MRPERTRLQGDAHILDSLVLEDSTVVATVVVSPNGTILGANARMRGFLGASSSFTFRGRSLQDFLVDPEDWSSWLQAKTSGTPLTARLRGGDGATIALRGDVRAAPSAAQAGDALYGVFVDVTEEQQLRAVILQGARMEALGSLTVGIAHDFNNLLTVLVGNLYLVAEDVRGQPQVFEKLKSARDAAKRGADLIRQLLTFARREQLEPHLVDAGMVIGDLAPLLKRALGGRVKFETQFEPGLNPIRASTAQLESVVVNLAINARDAIEKKGNVLVKVAGVQLSSSEAMRRNLSKPGGYVAISVADDGSGIPAEALDRIFEPFFSTKSERGGTGLGLSMVRWFAEQSRGAAYAESVPGRGTTVTLLLPDVPGSTAEAGDKTMPLSTLPSGTETVLVLASEEGLRSTILQILQVLGYSVRFAPESTHLLTMLRGEKVQLLIVDGGLANDEAHADLLDDARAIVPDLKVIVTTDTLRSAERAAASGAAVLLKPFSLADLATAVRQALDTSVPDKA
jgi:signal transduction histidine kinase